MVHSAKALCERDLLETKKLLAKRALEQENLNLNREANRLAAEANTISQNSMKLATEANAFSQSSLKEAVKANKIAWLAVLISLLLFLISSFK